jgi:hypothetical protein
VQLLFFGALVRYIGAVGAVIFVYSILKRHKQKAFQLLRYVA